MNTASNESSEEIRFSTGECVLGIVLIATSERGVCAILLGDDAAVLARDLEQRFPQATLRDGGTELEPLVSTVAKFVAAPAMDPFCYPCREVLTATHRRVQPIGVVLGCVVVSCERGEQGYGCAHVFCFQMQG